jgi:hypothetical protein
MDGSVVVVLADGICRSELRAIGDRERELASGE